MKNDAHPAHPTGPVAELEHGFRHRGAATARKTP